jgi:hypothetical protein
MDVGQFWNLYGNDLIRIAGAGLAAMISVIGAVWRLRRLRPNLYYGFQPAYPITLSADGLRRYWELRSLHLDPDHDVFTTDVFVGNRGGVAIRREDFDGDRPIALDIRAHRQIAYLEMGQMSPLDLRPEYDQPLPHVLAFPPLLLNAGDVVALKAVIVAGDPSPEAERDKQTRPQLHARIAGVTQYAKAPWLVRQGLPPAKVREILNGARRPAYVTLVVALAYLALLLILPNIYHGTFPLCTNTPVCAFIHQQFGIDISQRVGIDVYTIIFGAYFVVAALYYLMAAIVLPVAEILRTRYLNGRANRADEREHRMAARQGD